MYTKENYKKDILELLEKKKYNPIMVAKTTYSIFMNHQKDIDDNLYEKLLDIANMEMGPEFEKTEKEFMEFIYSL